MSFFWIITILILLLLTSSDSKQWGIWEPFYSDSVDAIDSKYDYKIRALYRRIAAQHLPDSKTSELIQFSDPTLDLLIYEKRFEDANNYRMRQLMEARDRRDHDAVENYTAYKTLISIKEAEYQEEKRRNLKYTHTDIEKKAKEQPPKVISDPMALPDEIDKQAPRKTHVGFPKPIPTPSPVPEWKPQESESVASEPVPLSLPPQELPQEKPDIKPEDNGDNYTELISI